jgi:hypothetical protein
MKWAGQIKCYVVLSIVVFLNQRSVILLVARGSDFKKPDDSQLHHQVFPNHYHLSEEM